MTFIDPTHLLVGDLRGWGLDTMGGHELPLDVIARGTAVQAHRGHRRTARGTFVGFDVTSQVLWVSWHFDPYREEQADRDAFKWSCKAFDALQAEWARLREQEARDANDEGATQRCVHAGSCTFAEGSADE